MKGSAECPQCSELARVVFDEGRATATVECEVCGYVGIDDKLHPAGPPPWFELHELANMTPKEARELYLLTFAVAAFRVVCLAVVTLIVGVGGGLWGGVLGLYKQPESKARGHEDF